jgi:hypothetical protein
VERLISQVETILEINPSLSEKEILETVAKNVADYLGAEAVSIRIYDPGREEMVFFGSYPKLYDDREKAIPLKIRLPGRW